MLNANLGPLKKALPFVAIVLSLLFGAGLLLGNTALIGAMWIVLGILLTLIMGIMAVMAGVTVIKTLFVVAAELSLLVFISQAYCSVPSRMPQNDAALKSLFAVGLIYIASLFVRSLIDALKENYKKVESGERSWQKKITMISYVLFVGLFVWELYLVISPIVLNLCVYQ